MVKKNEKQFKTQELAIVKNIDNISSNIAYKLGFNYVPWFTLTKILLGIYTALTCFVLFFRPDFINLTVCTAAIFMLVHTDNIKKWTFRILVLGIFISLLYDLFWFMLQDYSSDTSDGGVEKSVRNFSLSVAYFSFFFRVKINSCLTIIDHSSIGFLERLFGLYQNHQEITKLGRKQIIRSIS